MLSWGLIIPHNWRKTLLCMRPNALWMFFQSVLWEQPSFPALSELDSITCNTFGWSFSWSQVISSPACIDQYSPENSRVISRFLEFSFCAVLYSPVLLLQTLAPLVSPKFQLCLIKWGSPPASPCLRPPYAVAWKLSQDNKLEPS